MNVCFRAILPLPLNVRTWPIPLKNSVTALDLESQPGGRALCPRFLGAIELGSSPGAGLMGVSPQAGAPMLGGGSPFGTSFASRRRF